jgi:SAM-dependent methyltransferase
MRLLALFILAVILLFGFVVFRGSPYVPSRKKYIRQAFNELYPLKPTDVLIDIGSGDGIVLREAAEFGARAVGYEINPILVFVSRLMCRKYKNVSVVFADFWLSKIPNDTTVIYIFSATRDMKKILKKLQSETNRLDHPIKIISYGSDFDDMKIDKNVGAYHLYSLNPLQPVKAQV